MSPGSRQSILYKPSVARCVVVATFLSLLFFAIAGSATVKEDSTVEMASLPVRLAEGDSVSVVLTPMPSKHQLVGGPIFDLFSASSDSVLWCGPVRPNPHSWLSLSVVIRSVCDFDVVYLPVGSATVDTVYFGSVEPATYRVRVDFKNGPGPREYGLQFLYHEEVVHEFPRFIRAR